MSNAVLWNIIPTGIGNMIGSFIFVSVTYSFLFSSAHVVKKLAKQNGEVKKGMNQKRKTGATPSMFSTAGTPYMASQRNSVMLPAPSGRTLTRTQAVNISSRQSQQQQIFPPPRKFSEMQTDDDRDSRSSILFKKLEKLAKEKKNSTTSSLVDISNDETSKIDIKLSNLKEKPISESVIKTNNKIESSPSTVEIKTEDPINVENVDLEERPTKKEDNKQEEEIEEIEDENGIEIKLQEAEDDDRRDSDLKEEIIEM